MKLPNPLIDILSAESFATEHLPGALNFCVYETAFLDHVVAAFPDKTAPLSVYGLNDTTQEAEVALSRLREAGYSNVAALPGGLEGWKAHGGALERATQPAKPLTGKLPIDTENSVIRWTGRNLFNFHEGTLKLGPGHIEAVGNQLGESVIPIDMTSLHCSDLTDSAMNAMLIAHLRSTDFFDVETYPQAAFSIIAAHEIAGATAGMPNYQIRGQLTLRGHSHEIEFPALIAEKSTGGWVAQATLDLDRTLWGAHYGSGKFFARLGQHVVNDLVHLHLKIVTGPAETRDRISP
jgi:polyisoprenoid-binding protein YceI